MAQDFQTHVLPKHGRLAKRINGTESSDPTSIRANHQLDDFFTPGSTRMKKRKPAGWRIYDADNSEEDTNDRQCIEADQQVHERKEEKRKNGGGNKNAKSSSENEPNEKAKASKKASSVNMGDSITNRGKTMAQQPCFSVFWFQACYQANNLSEFTFLLLNCEWRPEFLAGPILSKKKLST